MKTILKILTIILFVTLHVVSCNNSADQKTDVKKLSYERYELNCPVKSIDVRTYEASSKFGEVIKGEPTYGNYLAEFDEVGNLIKRTDYFRDGDIFVVYKCVYDKKNNMIEETSYSGEGEQTSLVQNEYNADGKLLKSVSYDKDGNMDQCYENAYEDGCLRRNKRVEYEDDGTVVETEWINKWNGEILLERSLYRNGELISVYKFSDYKADSMAKGVEYDAEGVKQREFYEESGKFGVVLMKSHSCVDGSESEYRVERNKLGHVVYIYNSESDKKETYYEYEYDSNDNWIKKVEFQGVIRKPVEIVEREIKY